MIPLLQYVMGAPGAVAVGAPIARVASDPMALDSAVVINGFAMLMDQVATEAVDAAGMFAVPPLPLLAPPSLRRPEPSQGNTAPVTDRVAPQPVAAVPVGFGDLDTAIAPPLAAVADVSPVSDQTLILDGPSDAASAITSGPARPSEIEVRQPARPATAGPSEPESAAPKATAASVQETAFLAQDPQSDVTRIATMDTKQASVLAPVVVPILTRATGALPPDLPATEPDAVDDKAPIKRTMDAQPVSSLPPSKADLPIAGVSPSPAEKDPEKLNVSDLQATPLPGLDRPAASQPAAHLPMPASVPAAILAQAPQAAVAPVEVVLNPEELGKLRFEIHQQGDHIKVVLAVERPETLDLLRRHADQLVQEFRAAGYSGASLSFGHWGGQQGGASGQSAPAEPYAPAPDTALPPPISRSLAPSQGLNLRL